MCVKGLLGVLNYKERLFSSAHIINSLPTSFSGGCVCVVFARTHTHHFLLWSLEALQSTTGIS